MNIPISINVYIYEYTIHETMFIINSMSYNRIDKKSFHDSLFLMNSAGFWFQDFAPQPAAWRPSWLQPNRLLLRHGIPGVERWVVVGPSHWVDWEVVARNTFSSSMLHSYYHACMYICIHTSICIYIYRYMHAYIYMHIYICICI